MIHLGGIKKMAELDLGEIRAKLDDIDKKISDIFEERMNLYKKVAEYKISVGKRVFDKERENQKLDAVENLAANDFMKQCNRDLFGQIMAMSRRLQYGCVSEHEKSDLYGFKKVDSIPKDNIRVVYQGVEGAYSQAAMWQYFGHDVDAYNVELWRDAMEDVKNGKADYGVFPIENSTAGSVNDVNDLLIEYDNYIVGEVVLKISHALLGLEDSDISDIKKIYSHPQALMQSQAFLNSNRKWQQISMKNTAGAAKKVLEDNDITQAAVASVYAAKVYGLKVLKECITDTDVNATRFIVVANKKIYEKNANKISICFTLPNESGTLYNILGNFVYNHLNMTKIESHPTKNERWAYNFFVDFEGSLEDMKVKNALYAIENEASSFKLLGNY